MPGTCDYDYVVIGSGFGGSVSALRLAEKGYRVLLLEKGRWFRAEDFPATNWNLPKWLWMPWLRFFGFFRITFMRHITILSGVGVGGGSLVYANTLPIPKDEFFSAPTWAHLADWKSELHDHYQTALKMLGAAQNPKLHTGDLRLKELAEELDLADKFSTTDVAVYFDERNITVPDPYFGGKGPERSGCTFCGGCMIGCQHNAKNTLDKNYLYFAQKLGVKILAQSEVTHVIPLDDQNGRAGYRVHWQQGSGIFGKKNTTTTRGVVFAAGVLGTVKLLLKLRKNALPGLSGRIGNNIRTNSESLIGITSTKKDTDFATGIAIGAILQTDPHSHLETVRYPSGSGFWRIFMSPMVHAGSVFSRIFRIITDWIRTPVINLKTYFVRDWARHTQILLFMQTLNSTLRFKPGIVGLRSAMEDGPAPTAFIPEAKDLADRYAKIADGKATVLLTETLFGRPTTAHILGGAVMGASAEEGVIDRNNRVFGYENMYICDGSAISANPGVNPSLTITALSERAMSKIPEKSAEKQN